LLLLWCYYIDVVVVMIKRWRCRVDIHRNNGPWWCILPVVTRGIVLMVIVVFRGCIQREEEVRGTTVVTMVKEVLIQPVARSGVVTFVTKVEIKIMDIFTV